MNGKQQRILYRFFQLFPKQKKVVLLDNFGGMNLDQIRGPLLNTSAFGKVDVMDVSVRREPGKVSLKSLKGVYRLATAAVIVTNNHLDMPYKLRPDSKYIQLWHGTFPVKQIGQQMIGGYKSSLRFEPQITTSVICSSNAMKSVFAKGFGLGENQILPLGSPSTDVLFAKKSESSISNLKAEMGLDNGKKLLLYAPTFRESQSADEMFRHFDISRVVQALPDDWCLGLRLHRNSRAVLPEVLPNNVYDLSGHPLTEEVLMVSDALISDYSGLIFDFSILERPILLFHYDFEEYCDEKRERGLNLNPGQLPFPRAQNTNELMVLMEKLEQTDTSSVIGFKSHWFRYHDGRSGERVAEYVLSFLD